MFKKNSLSGSRLIAPLIKLGLRANRPFLVALFFFLLYNIYIFYVYYVHFGYQISKLFMILLIKSYIMQKTKKIGLSCDLAC
jgi:hypothetical protein